MEADAICENVSPSWMPARVHSEPARALLGAAPANGAPPVGALLGGAPFAGAAPAGFLELKNSSSSSSRRVDSNKYSTALLTAKERG